MCRALKLCCCLARPRLPIYLFSLLLSFLLTAAYSLFDPPRLLIFGGNKLLPFLIILNLYCARTRRFPEFGLQERHLRLFYFAILARPSLLLILNPFPHSWNQDIFRLQPLRQSGATGPVRHPLLLHPAHLPLLSLLSRTPRSLRSRSARSTSSPMTASSSLKTSPTYTTASNSTSWAMSQE